MAPLLAVTCVSVVEVAIAEASEAVATAASCETRDSLLEDDVLDMEHPANTQRNTVRRPREDIFWFIDCSP
jgi:hypothetical protein